MKRFTISGNFPALDIDDAFQRLAYHFRDEGWPDSEPTDPLGNSYSRFPGPYEFKIEPEADDA